MGRQEQGHRLGEEKRFNLMGYQMLLVFTFLTGILCISSDMITSLNLPAEGACTSLPISSLFIESPLLQAITAMTIVMLPTTATPQPLSRHWFSLAAAHIC